MLYKVIFGLIFSLGGLYLLAVCFLYFFQEKLIFFPEKLAGSYKYLFSVPHEEEYFEMLDGTRIHAIHAIPENPRGWVFYLHGNAGSLRTWGERASDFYPRGYACTIIDYRGYGKSTGKVTPETLFSDAAHIYDKVRKRHEGRHVIYGCSLGTGIAAWLAREKGADLLMLETPYYNLGDVSAQHYPLIPHNLLLRYPMRTDRYISSVSCPVVLIHGTHDEVIYHGSSLKLKKLLKEGDELLTIQDGRHNDLPYFPEYQELLDRYLSDSETQP